LVEQRVVQQIMHSLPQSRQPADQLPQQSVQQQQQQAPQQISQEQVIRQIMGLTEEQIGALPAEQQAQVRTFRAQYGGAHN
jgi:hypothetical protein